MNRVKSLSAAVLAAAIVVPHAAVSPARAQGDTATGAAIAQTWCAHCHAVESGRSALDAAPPFASIANERTDGEIRAFLARPHGLMPNIQLSRRQIEDVTAYFATLR
jgi:mono/diheme cytochrome c family protein